MLDRELFIAVIADVDKAIEQAQKDDNQYNRRSFVRSVFSAIEAITYMFKTHALSNIDLNIFILAEIALLREENYRLDSKGKASSYPRQCTVSENFRFAVEMMMRKYDPDYKIDTSSNGWRHFKNATKTRNRITHPRNAKDITLSSKDMGQVLLLFRWIQHNIMLAQAKSYEVLSTKLNEKPSEEHIKFIEIISKFEDV